MMVDNLLVIEGEIGGQVTGWRAIISRSEILILPGQERTEGS